MIHNVVAFAIQKMVPGKMKLLETPWNNKRFDERNEKDKSSNLI